MSSFESKTIVLITGANTGLGLETAKSLFCRPEAYHLLVGCRGDISRAQDAIAELEKYSPNSASTAEPLCVDISSDASIAAALQHVQARIGYIDVLVNNAGADLGSSITSGQLTERAGWNQTYDVNVTGTHLLTAALAPLLLACRTGAPRLLFLTSGLSSLREHAGGASPRYGHPAAGWPKPPRADLFVPYRVSKTALNMLAAEWGRLLRRDGVRVFVVSPGFLDTGLGDDRATGARLADKAAMGALDPAVGAEFCADVIEGKRDGQAWPVAVLRRDAVQQW